ncbi:hypothetical protein M408DRAFT_24830 [Serendipita vermifera MAFF 305830]|uniref:F-box domain-containing protein n=1 Tax=Serendipita vermifera MAFF 305830 TaxID=933852 RepID=A0A0C2WL93_SERVB|nr:hypothetical protein M408DRAFT_24830 [Serendipita vermifera MAFF 305830]
MATSIAARMPFDILAMIFEICAADDWRIPLRVGAVCRCWRTAVQSSPRAWRVVNMNTRRECHNLYFHRSGSYNLHVAMKSPYSINNIIQVAHRVQCLTTSYFVENVESATFPVLTTLRMFRFSKYKIDEEDQSLGAHLITTPRFPNLRHLEIHSIYTGPIPDDFPPLKSLQIVASEAEWVEFVAACNDSLVSPQITYDHSFTDPERNSVELPNLRLFKYTKKIDEDVQSPFELRTPSLQVYIEDANIRNQSELLHEDVSTVTYMRLQRLHSGLSTEALKRVRVLQLEAAFGDFCDALDELQKDPFLCYRLERLEFHSGFMDAEELDTAHEMLEEFE